MKKKNKIVLFVFAMLSLLFISSNVSALVYCEYHYGEDTIFLTKEDEADFFDRVLDSKYKLAKDNVFSGSNEGICPLITFDTDNKIYSSREKCLEAHKFFGEESCLFWEYSGTWKTIVDGFASGKLQAVLTSKNVNECIYQGKDGNKSFTINVNSNSGSGYRPDFSCDHDLDFDLANDLYRCEARTNSQYFYGANKTYGTSFICPKYIYYEYKLAKYPYRVIIDIVDVGGNEDPNKSGVSSDIDGDVKATDNDTTIKTSDLDCNGIFKGRLGQFLMETWKLLKFAVPILIIGFAIVDFIKAMSSHDDSEVKKAANKLVKRLVIGVLFFVLPTLIEFILGLADIEFGVCGIK